MWFNLEELRKMRITVQLCSLYNRRFEPRTLRGRNWATNEIYVTSLETIIAVRMKAHWSLHTPFV
jgi:hypothetical protein